ncbi:hypothetical protein FEM48_Zijuj08G0038900 [Ziziphus jujuba var. spinosa]|uniref:LOB domain-containing protein n=1 Tax=Ziziphus jujuba var. spinosa TaxID=714518 RepID=A0A978UWU7_ZIZJJ|nr:hypothetical protein FEM48_Zijuj08G0038900 [Ziziphus jujuba var. spinosa]
METTQVPMPGGGGRGVHIPCAACKMLRRKCDSNCLLSPYFPSEDIEKFAGVHRVFGASNVVKMIQMVEEANREDTVKALVYEATARLRDPVYGSSGAIFHLQKMVEELTSQLETVTAQASELQANIDQLLSILMNVGYLDIFSTMHHHPSTFDDDCTHHLLQHHHHHQHNIIPDTVASCDIIPDDHHLINVPKDHN